MAVNDQLDALLQDKRLTDDDWRSLAEVLKLDGRFLRAQLPEGAAERREVVNRELRHAYGHTFANVFRDSFEPDYKDVVRATAQKLKLHVRDHHSVEETEDQILAEVIDRVREHIIKEEGPEAWAAIEAEVEREVDRLIEKGDLPPGVADQLKKMRAGALMAAIVGGRLAGFALYLVANKLFFAIARSLGLRVGVAVAGPLIGRTLAFLLGPAGWFLTGVWLAYDVGNTNWKKVIPAVVIVIVLRRRFQFGEDGIQVV